MDDYEIDDFVDESRQRQKPWDDAKAFLAEIASCGVNTVSAMDAVLIHDANIRAEERNAVSERARHQTCKDCYNISDCGYAYNRVYECEKTQRIVASILNKE